MDLESDELEQIVYPIVEGFLALFNTNCREISEITVETSRRINCEIASQMSKNLGDIKSDLNSQVLQAINLEIAEKDHPTHQNCLGTQENRFNGKWTCGPVGYTGALK